jgi:glycosyltransferase involved in cell wall biosynthesis
MVENRPTFLMLSQVYVPDPTSLGQHMADAAAAMARRGYRVVVLTANRGYENPSIRYPARETLDGVDVRRLPCSSFGKTSIALRLLGGILFVLQCIVRGLFTPRLAGILVSTSPPMCSLAALVISWLRGVPIKYWVMDLNPDQMIALGKIKETSLAARTFNWLNRLILRRAADVIALDRFMAERVNRKRDVQEKLAVLPPWPHEEHLDLLAHAHNPFRKEHGWDGKFVFMFSGNLSLASPVTTFLEAALRLQDDPRLLFAFIGGGLGKKEVEQVIAQHRPRNIVSLPYQPLARLRYSLSAADVHLVSMGENMVGIIHPCKVYGAMAVARPVLLLGPNPCHITELLEKHRIGWQVSYGDVDGAVKVLRSILAMDPSELAAMGQRAQRAVTQELSMESLCGQFCDVLERGLTISDQTPSKSHEDGLVPPVGS